MLIYNVVLITTVQLSYSVKRVCAHSVVSDSVTLWAVAHQDPLSMGFFRQEYWNGLPFPSPGELPNKGIEPVSPVGRFFIAEPAGNICTF